MKIKRWNGFSVIHQIVAVYFLLLAGVFATPPASAATHKTFVNIGEITGSYHNTDTGRFWTQDSFEGFGTDPTSLHKYNYCGNNPVNALDPSGHFTLSEISMAQGIGATVGAGFGFYDSWRRSPGAWNSWEAISAGLKGAAGGAALGLALGPAFTYMPLLMAGPAGQMTLLMYGMTVGASAALDSEKYPDLAAIQVIGAFLPFLIGPRELVYTDELAMGYDPNDVLTFNLRSATLPASYDVKFAAQQLISNGKVSLSRLRSFVPNDAPNLFRPRGITYGQKYRFQINGSNIEVKFHEPDLNAAFRHPGSQSGSHWTAQIMVDRQLLGSDGQFYPEQQGDLTHILIEELP